MSETIVIDPIGRARLGIRIQGMTPLITNKWSEKAKQQMRDKQAGKATKRKDPKDPAKDAEAATYRLSDGSPGFPSVGFKAAIVGAARLYGKDVKMSELKQAVFVAGDGPDMLVPIIGDCTTREDMVRVGNGVADLRYRPQFEPWEATLDVRFLLGMLNPDSLVNLVQAAGLGGVGEWRPSAPKSHTGTYGQFEVVDVVEMAA